jgi:ABC-type glutathione transport system ATPase component
MQSPQAALSPTMRLGTLMRRALARHGVRGDAARTRAADAVAAVLLDGDILRRYPHEVSGGQAQRFAIALAIALGAEIIVADEPTSALDVTVQAEVVAVLRRLRDERGLALLLVSHDLALVSTIADRVLIMRDGRVVESGQAATVFATPANPYTRELIAAIPVLPDPEIPAPAPSDPKPSGPKPSGPEPSGPELSDPEPSGPEPSGSELSDSEPSGPERSVSGLSDSVWSDLEQSGPVCTGPVRPEEAS